MRLPCWRRRWGCEEEIVARAGETATVEKSLSNTARDVHVPAAVLTTCYLSHRPISEQGKQVEKLLCWRAHACERSALRLFSNPTQNLDELAPLCMTSKRLCSLIGFTPRNNLPTFTSLASPHRGDITNWKHVKPSPHISSHCGCPDGQSQRHPRLTNHHRGTSWPQCRHWHPTTTCRA